MKLENLMDIENVSLDLEATHETTGERIKDSFCDNWGKGRPAVEGLLQCVKNPIVKVLIRCVLSLGDVVKERICPEKPNEIEK